MPRIFEPVCRRVAVVAALLASACACAESGSHDGATKVAEAPPTATRLPGYLAPDERPDSIALVPPPPASGSDAYVVDVETHRATRTLRDTPRWRMAVIDADVEFPQAANIFACALGVPISERDTPNLYVLMQRTMIDAGKSTSAAKAKYQRPRPFVVYDETICVPEDADQLRGNGSYPSGHASVGWAWALILAEIAPQREEELLRRGREFGKSRVICGVHWQSDVDTGRTVGEAVVRRLHDDDEFVTQLGRARQEVAAARRAGTAPRVDCMAEDNALAGGASSR